MPHPHRGAGKKVLVHLIAAKRRFPAGPTPHLLSCVLLLAVGPACAQQAKSRASSDFDQAQSLLEQHRFHEAQTAVLDALHRHPSSVEGYNLLGIIESELQEPQNALTAFRKALQLSPNSVKTHVNLGNLYAAEQQMNLAEEQFRDALHLSPSDQDANYALGVLLMMRNQPALAIPHFERIHPPTVAARLNLVRAYLATQRTQDALKSATALSEQAGNNVQVHFSLGVLLASQKQYPAAQTELERADALQPGSFEILYNLGLVYLRTAQNAKADLVLNRALKLQPDSVDALSVLAQTYTAESRPLDALDLLLQAHKLAPQNPDILFQMAQISMAQSYFEDAIPLLEEGLKVAPRRPDLLAALGESDFMAGKVDKSIEAFNQLVQVDPSARSYAFLGLAYRNLGRFDEARNYFEKGLKLDPHSTPCLFNLGYIAERQGNTALADSYFQQTLQVNPNFSDALLELANLRIVAHRYAEAEPLLRRFVNVSHDPATGYYKLAMVERGLHENQAAERDLNVFKTLSRSNPGGPYPYQHLFDYLDNRLNLPKNARNALDLNELVAEVQRHPDQPQDLYLLAKTYLKLGRLEDAKTTIAQLDKVSADDYRTLAGTGVLLAQYHLYDDAILHFQQALQVNPGSDDIRFDLANAYFARHDYTRALDIAKQISDQGQKDNGYLSLLGDIYAHLGQTGPARQIYEDAMKRNPDDDRAYLSLALLDLRTGDVAAAQQVLEKGQARITGSGKLYWGIGLTDALQGKNSQAIDNFKRAVDLLPEWTGAYSTLGVFYFQTGQIDKAREVLDRFKDSSASGSLEINRIEQVLDQAAASHAPAVTTLTASDKAQLLQFALSLADRTL